MPESDRRERMDRIRREIEKAGGSQVWVRTPHPAGIFPPKADSPVTLLAARGAYDRVLAALHREADQQQLDTKVRPMAGAGRPRAAEISLWRRSQLVGRWQLREVRQLYRAAIIIDDLGQDVSVARRILVLPYPVALSVLPHLLDSTRVAHEAERAGREALLHLPMEPGPGSPARAGPGEIRVGMTEVQAARVIEHDLASVPGAAGVNNHMGSRATTDVALMTAVMRTLRERGLYFVDSRTTARSVALEIARREGVPAFYRSVFLDDTPTVPYTLGQLRKFEQVVERQGIALAIGHPYSSTLTALAQFLPELDRSDVQLVPISQLVHLPEVARLSPPAAPE